MFKSLLPFLKCFVWTTVLNKILTINNLKLRNFPTLIFCYLRWRNEESVDHYSITANLFYLFGTIFYPYSLLFGWSPFLEVLFSRWGVGSFPKNRQVLWKMVLLATYSLWLERNRTFGCYLFAKWSRRCFNGLWLSILLLVLMLLCSILARKIYIKYYPNYSFIIFLFVY